LAEELSKRMSFIDGMVSENILEYKAVSEQIKRYYAVSRQIK
jgi:hypothetical protein